jgi:hypothetical protein
MQDFFTLEEGHDPAWVTKVLDRASRGRVTDLHYEATMQCHINHSCDVLGRYLGKSEARTMTLTRVQYLVVSYKTLLLTHSMKNR